ncbi:Exc2 family lipoprotein [Serratia nevei]|uniref:Exc2 family lipoprotein n=1 Tax=Serratia nevei TaxID=2703794 RepID=UPI003F76FD19
MTTRPNWKAAVLITSLFTLAGCNTPSTSAERHAKHFTYASDDGFDPNFNMRKHETVKLSIPFFKQFWLEGKNDREKGISKEDANKRVIYFSSDEFFNSFKNYSVFAGKEYNAEKTSPKWRKAMSDAASGAYRDGYEGRD